MRLKSRTLRSRPRPAARARARLTPCARPLQLVYTGRELDNQRTLSFYQLVAGGEYPMTLVLRTKGM